MGNKTHVLLPDTCLTQQCYVGVVVMSINNNIINKTHVLLH
jgi:hypothetical protein